MAALSLEKRKKEFVESVVAWAEYNLRDFQWRRTDSPYEIFVAESLLKRTTSTAAERVFGEFLANFPDIESLAEADVGRIEKILEPIGLYRQRSKGLKEAAEFVVQNYGGELPKGYEKLLDIPHIGPYAAGAIMSFGFGEPVPILDSNVRRVISSAFRDLLGDSPRDKEVIKLLGEVLPKDHHRLFNLGLIDLGALICNYRESQCYNCPLKDMCSVANRSGEAKT